jgi:hypothetical protein
MSNPTPKFTCEFWRPRRAKNGSKNDFIPLAQSRYSQNYLNGVKRGLNGNASGYRANDTLPLRDKRALHSGAPYKEDTAQGATATILSQEIQLSYGVL